MTSDLLDSYLKGTFDRESEDGAVERQDGNENDREERRQETNMDIDKALMVLNKGSSFFASYLSMLEDTAKNKEINFLPLELRQQTSEVQPDVANDRKDAMRQALKERKKDFIAYIDLLVQVKDHLQRDNDE